tara:strand:- start:7008 stop:7328 length:321 start_codon:yes stop_codon:yes gene_type:complete
MTKEEIISIIEDIDYKNWGFNIQEKEDGYNLQAILSNNTKSGKWYISPYITKSELVQRCFLCVLQAEEHQIRLEFTYKNSPIFKPHYDVDDLVELSKRSIDKRHNK